jgi:hypothetical protein
MRRKSNTAALLERARGICDPPTWYRLSKNTGIKAATLSRCMVQGKTLGDINAWKLARFLGMEAKDVMAYMAEDRAQDEPTKRFWGSQLPRLLSAAAIALTLSFGCERGALAVEGSQNWGFNQLYIMRSRMLTWLASLKTLTRRPPPASAAA